MAKSFVVILVLVALAVFGLSVRIIFRRGGTFGSHDVGDDPNMKARGIDCTMEQDLKARKRTPIDISKL